MTKQLSLFQVEEKKGCHCPLADTCESPYIFQDGGDSPEIVIIGDAPGELDDKTRKLFYGRSGQFLRDTLKEFGVDLDKVTFCNIISCYPPDGKAPTQVDIKNCLPNLKRVLKKILPSAKIVFLMGNTPMKVLLGKTGISKFHGLPYYVKEKLYFPLYHPAYILKNPNFFSTFVKDIETGINLMNSPFEKINIPSKGVDSTFLEANKNEIISSEFLAYDTETSGLDPYKEDAYLIGVSLCWGKDNSIFVPLKHNDISITEEEYSKRVHLLKEILENPVLKKITHNGKFDRIFLKRVLDIEVSNSYFDTMLAHHLLKEKSKHSLSNVVRESVPQFADYDLEMASLMADVGNEMSKIPINKIVPYACGDAFVTFILHEKFINSLEEEELIHIYFDIVNNTSLYLSDMEGWGVALNQKLGRKYYTAYSLKLDEILFEMGNLPLCKRWENLKLNSDKMLELRTSMEQSTTKSKRDSILTRYEREKDNAIFNPNSPQQVIKLVYELGNLPTQYNKDTKNPTCGKGAREALLKINEPKLEDGLDVIRALDNYNKISALYKTYISKWETWLHDDNLMHPNMLQHGTVTGRLSVRKPNFQNIPRNVIGESPLDQWLSNHNIKNLFISKFGNKGVILNADYSQLELRIMACISRDKSMLKAYTDGGDLHETTARKLFPDFETVSKRKQKEYRTIGKVENFSSMYAMKDEFLDLYPQLKLWVEETKEYVKKNGYVKNMFGRRRRFPELKDNPNPPNHLLRQAVNFCIQSTGHDILLKAGILINSNLKEKELKSHLIFEVHDSLILDCYETDLDIVVEMLYNTMSKTEEYDWLTIPLDIEITMGSTWGKQTKIERKKV